MKTGDIHVHLSRTIGWGHFPFLYMNPPFALHPIYVLEIPLLYLENTIYGSIIHPMVRDRCTWIFPYKDIKDLSPFFLKGRSPKLKGYTIWATGPDLSIPTIPFIFMWPSPQHLPPSPGAFLDTTLPEGWDSDALSMRPNCLIMTGCAGWMVLAP